MAGRFVAWMNAHEFNPDDYQVNTLVGTVLFKNQESAAMWVLLDHEGGVLRVLSLEFEIPGVDDESAD